MLLISSSALHWNLKLQGIAQQPEHATSVSARWKGEIHGGVTLLRSTRSERSMVGCGWGSQTLQQMMGLCFQPLFCEATSPRWRSNLS